MSDDAPDPQDTVTNPHYLVGLVTGVLLGNTPLFIWWASTHLLMWWRSLPI